ncbi:MAG: hypothetical protein WCK56_03035 [Alcaligenaceae bacterium]
MARLPRLYAPAFAQLITAQFVNGINLALNSTTAQTYLLLLTWLGQSARLYGVAVHGWCLSPKGLCFLLTPSDALGVPRVMQDLGRRLAAHLKIGTVFIGRYRSTIPEPEHWVLSSLIWLERSPVREGLVNEPAQWAWSSAVSHTERGDSPASWLQPHHDYWLCGNTPFDRQAAYRKQLNQGNTTAQDQKISAALRGQWGLGSATFLTELTASANRRVAPGVRGRPKRIN